MKTGCPWRYLPDCFGKPSTVFKSFRRWPKPHKLRRLFKRLIQNLIENGSPLMVLILEHIKSSAGAAGRNDQAIAKSVGRNSSKIHLIVDAHGNPLEFQISDGVTHDVKIAPELLKKVELKGLKY